MRPVKPFSEFIEKGIVKKVREDKERAKSLISESERKLNSLKEQLEKIGIKEENANDYVEYCYDTIMYLLRAKLYIEGYKSSGQGAHAAEVAYMKELGFGEKKVQFLDQLRYFRNGILYYGKMLDKEYANKVVDFTKRIYPELRKAIG